MSLDTPLDRCRAQVAASAGVGMQPPPYPAGQSERYEDLLRASVDWIWEIDSDHRLIYVCPHVARHLGIPAERLTGRFFHDVGRLDQDAAVLKNRRGFRNAAFVTHDAEGREIGFRISGVPYYDPINGCYAGHRGTAVRDTFAQEKSENDTGDHAALASTLEEILLRHNDLEWKLNQAQASNVLTQENLAKLLHELRTPLNAMMGYAELALHRVEANADGGPLSDNLRHIREAGRHMDRLLAELPDRHVFEDGNDAQSIPTTDLSQVITDARAMTELAARRADIRFQRIQGPQSLIVEGDRKALTQILVNLLSNAAKFTPSGGEIGVSVQETGISGVRVAVWDTGPGIPSQEQQRIFERNYRMAQHSCEEGPPGSGLGLAIARQLAHENGAELTVESTPGQGSTFYLDLKQADLDAGAVA